MREFKFRAWHEYGDCPVGPSMIYDTESGDCLHWKNEGQNIISVMQSTGLKDITGKEIYESDIVTGTTTEGYTPDLIKFTAIVRWDESDTGFFYSTNDDTCPYIKMYHAVGIEIVGNIYENEFK